MKPFVALRAAARRRMERSAVGTLDSSTQQIVETCRPFTMTSRTRLVATIEAVRYLELAHIPGDIVECGVWKGGHAMAAALTLLDCGSTNRQVWLFDTFKGMTAPTSVDTSVYSADAGTSWRAAQAEGIPVYAQLFAPDVFSLEQVRANLLTTGYPPDRVRFVKGPVETNPQCIPKDIALLRLDTDWYESTRHELEHLYPRLRPGGALAIDDYGHWDGARRAVDEYFADAPIFLSRTDYSARMAIKP